MKRITVQEVKAAYEQFNWKPTCKDFGNGHDCGCPLVAVLKSRGSETPYSDSLDLYDQAGYAYGFVVAVDGECRHWQSNDSTQERDAGYSDGLAVREAIFGKGA